jgi:hypothetical protein
MRWEVLRDDSVDMDRRQLACPSSLVRVHQSGGSQSVTFDLQATIGNRVYSIKQQGDSWVVIRAVNDVDDRYDVFDSMDAAKRQAEEWEQAV